MPRGRGGREAALATLDGRANGIFLYARYAVLQLERSVKEREGRPLTRAEVDAFPADVGGFYGEQLTRLLGRKGDDGKATLEGVELERSVPWRLLRLVVAAREPVPVDAIEALLECTRKQRVDAVGALSNLLPVRDGRMHPYHKTLFDWLGDGEREEYVELSVDRAEVHAALGARCAEIGRACKGEVVEAALEAHREARTDEQLVEWRVAERRKTKPDFALTARSARRGWGGERLRPPPRVGGGDEGRKGGARARLGGRRMAVAYAAPRRRACRGRRGEGEEEEEQAVAAAAAAAAAALPAASAAALVGDSSGCSRVVHASACGAAPRRGAAEGGGGGGRGGGGGGGGGLAASAAAAAKSAARRAAVRRVSSSPTLAADPRSSPDPVQAAGAAAPRRRRGRNAARRAGPAEGGGGGGRAVGGWRRRRRRRGRRRARPTPPLWGHAPRRARRAASAVGWPTLAQADGRAAPLVGHGRLGERRRRVPRPAAARRPS